MSAKIIVFIFDAMALLIGNTLWSVLQPFDSWLLTKINRDWSNSFLDAMFPLTRETLFWIPLYIFLFTFMVLNFRKNGAWWIVAFLVTAALGDIISSQVIKQLIFRTRPCQEPSVAEHLHFIINYCPISSSFTSSHATNHFGQAMFFYLTLRNTSKWWGLAFAWAFLIAYGQVYVGVHYPFDVLSGSLLGCAIGWCTATVFNKKAQLPGLYK